MSQANDSVLVTPGVGATVATHTINSKEHQVIMLADVDGHILNSRNVYGYNIPSQVHVAAANTVHWDLYNADPSLILRVTSIRQKPDIVTAVTGVAFAWKLARTTAVGTGGVVQTAFLRDLSQAALSANITCRSKPTGGATEGVIFNNYSLHSEETNAGTMVIASMGGLELLTPQMIAYGGMILRPNQGMRCVQITNSAAGNTGWSIEFEVDN